MRSNIDRRDAMFNQLAINSNSYSGFTLEQALKGASAAGFTKIELAAVEHTPHLLATMSEAERNEVKSLLKQYGMTVVGIGAHSNVMTTEGIENLLKSIDLSTSFDCHYVITGTGDAHNDSDVIEDEKRLIKDLTPVLEKCERLGKTLAIETHGKNYATGLAVKKLAEQFDYQIKINYDTGNVIFYGDTSPYEDLKASVERIAFIHLKDKLGDNKEWNFPAIGKGNLNFRRIFDILEQAHFEGPISVEIEFTPEGPSSLLEVDETVKQSFEYLKQLLGW